MTDVFTHILCNVITMVTKPDPQNTLGYTQRHVYDDFAANPIYYYDYLRDGNTDVTQMIRDASKNNAQIVAMNEAQIKYIYRRAAEMELQITAPVVISPLEQDAIKEKRVEKTRDKTVCMRPEDLKSAVNTKIWYCSGCYFQDDINNICCINDIPCNEIKFCKLFVDTR